MKLKSNQIKTGLTTSSGKYHENIIESDDIQAIRIKVFDNEPQTNHVYIKDRYKVIWEIWDKSVSSDDLNDKNFTHKLTNKLSNFKSFKNVMYTDQHKPWYVKLVNDCRKPIEENPNECILQCALGSKGMSGPFMRMPYFANQFVFSGNACYGKLFIHEFEFEFDQHAQEWEHEDNNKRSWQQEYYFDCD